MKIHYDYYAEHIAIEKHSQAAAAMIFALPRSEGGVSATLMLTSGCSRAELIDLGGKRMVANCDVEISLTRRP